MSLSPEREGRYTASGHAAGLGMNPYCTRPQFWRQHKGIDTFTDAAKERMQWGNDHEADALAFYQSETGELCEKTLDEQIFVTHSNWTGCTPDGFVGDDGLVEFKCPVRLWEVPPDHYWVQVQSQLEFTGRKWCDLCAWTPDESRIWRVERLEDYWKQVKDPLYQFFLLLIGDVEPGRSRKPKFDWEIKWTRTA